MRIEANPSTFHTNALTLTLTRTHPVPHQLSSGNLVLVKNMTQLSQLAIGIFKGKKLFLAKKGGQISLPLSLGHTHTHTPTLYTHTHTSVLVCFLSLTYTHATALIRHTGA